MMRALYATLLWLHPPAFRRQFATEMLWIFDEARGSEGAFALLLDGAVSVLRQWLARSGLWIVAAALLGATLQVAPFLRIGLPRTAAVPHTSGPAIPVEAFFAITMGMLAFVVSMVVASVFWSTRLSGTKRK
jgi:hypothetical protein